MKKERVNNIIDSKKSQIRKLNLTIKTLKNVKEQFNNEFHIKYNQYLQNIERQIEEEKNINNKLLLKIHDIKKEMLLIESKIQKTQFEKEKMSKWFFLQIQVKEKFKDFPSYEKDVFDNYYIDNDNKKDIRSHTIVIKKHRTTRRYYIEEINKINEYKNKIIFENADDFFFENTLAFWFMILSGYTDKDGIKNLEDNMQTLLTPYDIHDTLSDIFSMK